MILQEFMFQKQKNKRLAKSLERANKIKKEFKGKEDYCDDGIKPDCKCEWEGDCESVCRHGYK